MRTKLEVKITEFLSAFFPDLNEIVNFRAIKPKKEPDTEYNRPKKIAVTLASLASNSVLKKAFYELNKTRGIYFVVNSGGNKKADITRFNSFFIEIDDLSIEEQHAILDEAPIQPSIRVETLKSVHSYWLITGDCSREKWEQVQERLIEFFGSDKVIKDASRVMRVPHFNYVSYDANTKKYSCERVIDTVVFEPSRRFTAEQMLEAFPVEEIKSDVVTKPASQRMEGQKKTLKLRVPKSNNVFTTFEKRHSELIRCLLGHPTSALNGNGIFDCQGICHNGIGNTALMFDPATGVVHCNKGCDYPTILRAFGLPDEYLSSSNSQIRADDEMKKENITPQLDRKALFGLAGDFVKTIYPHTEADESALLIQLLVGFGNMIGRSAYYIADGSKHHTNLYALIVGKTSAAKGSALSHVKNQFKTMEEDWAMKRIQSGLSSGEGLIKAVENNVILEHKRLLVVESEFASVLQMQKREGNILSTVLRNFWDNGEAQTLTKNEPVTTTGAHVSIIGHITPEELERCINSTDLSNGYANRFLFTYVKRSKNLPDGGRLSQEESLRLTKRFKEAVDFAKNVQEMKRDEEAAKLWRDVYQKLVEDKEGIFGKVIARARAQILRLSCIYALLDLSETIRREHLESALALWEYCEDSARYIFRGDTLSKDARKLHDWLCEANDKGMNKTEIFKKFGNRIKADKLETVLNELSQSNVAFNKEVSTAGREEERWYVVNKARIDEFDEERFSLRP
ncbi:MAG TPA: DUF3987 domain-containing protein [Pyrinomonadaceae bacterium]|jgi:hypothetical protein